MSNIPTVKVTARFADQRGRPVHRALITMRLATVERYAGYVVPRETRAETDPDGKAVLEVWPNELGTESSEYVVTVLFPEACAVNGAHHSHLPPLRSIRGHAVVPNSDCNLQDIMELPPYEQRGAGQAVTAEVAGWAAAAGQYADAAKDALAAARSVETRLNAMADGADAAKTAAQEAAASAQASEKRAGELVDDATGVISHFRDSVVTSVEKTARRLTTEATVCINQHKTSALEALELRTGEALTEITETATRAGGEAVQAVKEAEQAALDDIDAAGKAELERLREEAALYGEDFENLTERAEAAAKRAGCSAASAANSATKACACAERAESAAQGLERAKEEALDAARRAETAQVCAESAAQRAEAAADMSQQNANYAAGSAKAAQESAKAADASAALAKQSAEMAVAAQQAAAQDRAYVEGVAEDVEQAVHDVAVELLTPQVITDAVVKATEAAENAATDARSSADEAAASALTATQQANLAKKRADRAEAARDVAEDLAGKLLKDYHFEQHALAMSAQIIRLADRVTQVELDHVHGATGTGVGALTPGGYSPAPGVTVAPITIADDGAETPAGAAVTARIADYVPCDNT